MREFTTAKQKIYLLIQLYNTNRYKNFQILIFIYKFKAEQKKNLTNIKLKIYKVTLSSVFLIFLQTVFMPTNRTIQLVFEPIFKTSFAKFVAASQPNHFDIFCFNIHTNTAMIFFTCFFYYKAVKFFNSFFNIVLFCFFVINIIMFI